MCMDNCKKLFFDLKPTKSGTLTKRITKGLEIKAYSTTHWIIVDDLGQVHHLAFKQAAYDLNLLCALLSSQPWSQQANNNFPNCYGTKMEQYSDNCILYWGQWTFCKTILLDPNSNTPYFYSALGTTKFCLISNQFDQHFH